MVVSPHHRALAVVFLDTAEGDFQSREFVFVQIQGFRVDSHFKPHTQLHYFWDNPSTCVPIMQQFSVKYSYKIR